MVVLVVEEFNYLLTSGIQRLLMLKDLVVHIGGSLVAAVVVMNSQLGVVDLVVIQDLCLIHGLVVDLGVV
jgi:hypothetical protein